MNEDGIKHLNWFKKIYQTKEYNEELFDDIDYKELLNEISTYYLVHVNIKLKQMF